MKFKLYKRTFHFKNPSGTSRGILKEKHSWFIELWDEINPEIIGIGECSVIEGLSPDFKDAVSYENKIHTILQTLNTSQFSIESNTLKENPSIKFGIETALLDLKNGGKGIIFQNEFTSGTKKLAINGLIWMGEESTMLEQINQKLEDGFTTIKIKIGAIDLEKELKLLRYIRSNYSAKEITLRVDANGAFTPHQAITVLENLAELEIHSIEQPIKPGQWNEMKELCTNTPTPIALDEELIGINDRTEKIKLLDTINPQFIILKPSLHGGISGSREWIRLVEERNIPWWTTSALESNVGLNAICQFAAEFNNELPQGLGTGSLYTENIESDLIVEGGFIFKNGQLTV